MCILRLNQPSQQRLSWAHTLDIPPGIKPVCAISLILLHWLSNCICLSWAFFPFTHSLCRVARQISIIHKQLSYLPQRTTQVFVYWFKINNLHSWVCSEHLSWRSIWNWNHNRSVKVVKKWSRHMQISLWQIEKILWFFIWINSRISQIWKASKLKEKNNSIIKLSGWQNAATT